LGEWPASRNDIAEVIFRLVESVTLAILREIMRYIISIVIGSLLFGCGSGKPNANQYSSALKASIDGITLAKQFEEAFPASKVFISHFDGRAGPRTWVGKTIISQRFLLEVSIPIDIEFSTTWEVVRVSARGLPKIAIYEVTRVERRADGTTSIGYGRGTQVTPDQLEVIITNKNVSSIFADSEQLQPINNVDAALE